MLTISVENFGPITEGTVELKPLTIFVGPSNTGKSYMATAVYAVMKAVEGRYRVPMLMRIGVPVGPEYAQQSVDIPFGEFPQDLKATIGQEVDGVIGGIKETALRQMTLSYGGELRFLRRTTEPSDFRLRVNRREPNFQMDIPLQDNSELPARFDLASMSMSPGLLNLLTLDESREDLGDGPGYSVGTIKFNKRAALNGLLEDALELTFSEFPSNSFYLPAARSGMVQAHKVLTASLVRQSYRVGLEAVNIPTLPSIAADFLGTLISLDPRLADNSSDNRFLGAIRFIESEVLHGEVDLDESGGLPFPDIAFHQRKGDTLPEKFHVHETSSMVSELAPLILFLKYVIRPGHMLVFEEPESHLHPAAQRQLARGIVRLVNAGVKVIITTHSDTFVSQINNLLALSQAGDDLIAERGFEAADLLRQEQVGAYLFRYSQELGGSVITPLEIDPDTGIDEEEFAEVFESLYDESIALQRDRA